MEWSGIFGAAFFSDNRYFLNNWKKRDIGNFYYIEGIEGISA